VEAVYLEQMQSFEGIKPPYRAPDVDAVNAMLTLVHLGKRFTASAVAQVVADLATECVESALYCLPLHQQHHYRLAGWQRGRFPLAERIADRALALPLHGALTPDHVRFIVQTLKDSSVNVGAGAAIY
jgi:perosamine synthetase